jgi:hypothetical protein
VHVIGDRRVALQVFVVQDVVKWLESVVLMLVFVR